MQVADIMTTGVLTVAPSDTALKAAELIAKRHVSGVFVIRGGRLVGVVSHSDLLNRIFPSYSEFYDDLVHNLDFEEIQGRAADLATVSVKEVMREDVLTVAPEVPVMKVAAWMLLKDVHRAAVVDGEQRLRGVISRGDIFYHTIDRHAHPEQEVTEQVAHLRKAASSA